MGKGVNLASLQRDDAEVEVPTDAGVLTVRYRPSAYTPESEASFVTAGAGDVKSQFAVAFVEALVIEWDLYDNEVPVPLTKEQLSKLPVVFLGMVIEAIAKHLAGKVGAQTD